MKPFLGPRPRRAVSVDAGGPNGDFTAIAIVERTAVGPTSADVALLSDASKEAKEIVAQFKRSYGHASNGRGSASAEKDEGAVGVETTDGDLQTTEEKRPRKRPRAAVKSRAPRMPRSLRKIDREPPSGEYVKEDEFEEEFEPGDLGTSLGRQLEAEDSGSRVDGDWEDPGESADIEPESATVAEYRKRTLEGIQRRLRTRPRDR
jgi:hypothetical protein